MKAKYVWEYVIQGDYGYGWEDVTVCEDYEEAKGMLKCYDDNEIYAHRIKKVRKTVK